jgi:uncharacterized protein with ParB-like and HNH nuclease domain
MEKDDNFIEASSEEDEELGPPLQPYDILTYPADFTLEGLVTKVKNKEILNAPGQRKFLWQLAQASKLIESFILGLPVPPIFLYIDRQTGKLLVVDGQQRLRSIVCFFSGWFSGTGWADGKSDEQNGVPFKLEGLHPKSAFIGATFQTLKDTDEEVFNRLKNSVLRAFVMKQVEPQDDTSIFQIFERLNTGGMILQGQEIRNCLYEGDFNELLKELNKGETWRQIVGKKAEDKRMRDVEMILRFYTLFYDVKKYKKPMKGFLNRFMRIHRRPSEGEKAEYANLFEQTAAAVVKYLGPKPFHIRRGLNAAVFDSVFTAFARHLDEIGDGKDTSTNIRRVKANYHRLLKDDDYKTWVGSATTDKDVVPRRLERAEEILFR